MSDTTPPVTVAGRHAGYHHTRQPDLHAELSTAEDFLVVRLGDESSPDFWMDVHIPSARVQELLGLQPAPILVWGALPTVEEDAVRRLRLLGEANVARYHLRRAADKSVARAYAEQLVEHAQFTPRLHAAAVPSGFVHSWLNRVFDEGSDRLPPGVLPAWLFNLLRKDEGDSLVQLDYATREEALAALAAALDATP